jgi:GNAT superfamily N-acetyltransferase
MKATVNPFVQTAEREQGLPFFTDRQGRAYAIYWYAGQWEAVLLYGGKGVGRLELVWKPPCLELADLTIAPRYRGRGLGSAVLEAVIALARQREIREITGSIVRKDLARLPHLPDWYARHGFRVTPVSSGARAFDLSLLLGPEASTADT